MDLCAYYRFNEVQSGKVLDASGHNNAGTLADDANVSPRPLEANNPLSDEDEWGERVQLGHSIIGEVFCDEIRLDSVPPAVTLELYVRRVSGIKSSASSPTILSFNGTAKLFLANQAEITLSVADVEHATVRKLILNEWTHVALVMTESTSELYVNGASVLSVDQGVSLDQSWSVSLGSNVTEITEVRVWACSRTEAEIRQYMTVCLPKAAPVSRWKGMRINIKADASSKSPMNKPIPNPMRLPKIKTRRVVETTVSDEVTALAEQVLEPPTRSPPFQEQVQSPPKPASEAIERLPPPLDQAVTEQLFLTQVREQSAPSPHEAKKEQQFSQVRVESTPSPAPRQVSEGSVASQPPQIPEVPQPQRQKDPEHFMDQKANTILVPSDQSQAISLFDSLLESSILEKGLAFDSVSLESIVRAISSYVRSHFRIGPYLAPMPPETILSRLRIAATYLGVSKVMHNVHVWESLRALRMPLLREHIPLVLLSCIEEAKRRGDNVCLSMLARALVKEYGSGLNQVQMEELGRYMGDVSGLRTTLACPFCSAKLRDPLQASCYDGCGTRFAVCFRTGSVVAVDDCAKCRICSTIVSVKIAAGHRGNIPSNVKVSLPPACYVCGCLGSLVPMS